jgi:hypothetical protein
MNIEVQFGEIIRGLKKLEKGVNAKGEDIVRLRFEQGCLLKDIVGKSTYGENAVERVAKETSIPEGTLRVAYGHAKRFHFKLVSLDKEINRLKESGKSISYGYFRAALKPETNSDLHGGPEKHKEHLLKEYERAGTSLSAARDHYPEDEQVKGAEESFAQVTEDAQFAILGDRGTSGIKRGKRFLCPQYISFIHEHKCCVSGVSPVEAHHLVYRSRGGQASDLLAVPLSSGLHQEYHAIGHDKFIELYNIDFNAVVMSLLENFINEILK